MQVTTEYTAATLDDVADHIEGKEKEENTRATKTYNTWREGYNYAIREVVAILRATTLDPDLVMEEEPEAE